MGCTPNTHKHTKKANKMKIHEACKGLVLETESAIISFNYFEENPEGTITIKFLGKHKAVIKKESADEFKSALESHVEKVAKEEMAKYFAEAWDNLDIFCLDEPNLPFDLASIRA
jgi:hypothetical protein